ncbi:Protein of unknown function [Cotesia congregata]|uniref:Uncharacterized protein n=1 Tax=Cotesia congregata TaxID=51543 RepID=A0A8J2N0S4_COTCN|nr:Protein of unknown function [Cotesia congregata]
MRRSVQAHINQLNWFVDQFSRLGNHVVGGDLNQEVKLKDLENAFADWMCYQPASQRSASFLQASRDIVINKEQSVLRDLTGLKVNVEFFCTFRKHQQDIEERKSFITKSREILPATALQDWYTKHVYEKLKQRIEDFEHEGSGWSLLGPNSLMSEIPTIHLLMIKKSVNYTDNLDNIESVYHFAWIHNLSGVIKSQIFLGHSKLYFCDRCLNHFKLKECYLEHRVDCFKSNKVRLEFPSEKNKILKFKDFKSKDTVPFVVYADLECTLEPPGDDEKTVHKHVPHSIAYYVHCSYNNTLSKFELNRSPDCINWFVKQLESLALDFEKILKNPIKMKPLTNEQQDRHNQVTQRYFHDRLYISDLLVTRLKMA